MNITLIGGDEKEFQTKCPKRIADALAMAEGTVEERKAKYSKLQLLALKAFPNSPIQNKLREEYLRVKNIPDSYTVHHELEEMIDEGWDASEALAFLNID